MAEVVGRKKPGLFAIRDVSSLLTETHETGHELKRAVSSWQLTAMGVGAIIGTGIFVVIGEGAAIAGPAVILSFALAALACVFPHCPTQSSHRPYPCPAVRTPTPTQRSAKSWRGSSAGT